MRSPLLVSAPKLSGGCVLERLGPEHCGAVLTLLATTRAELRGSGRAGQLRDRSAGEMAPLLTGTQGFTWGILAPGAPLRLVAYLSADLGSPTPPYEPATFPNTQLDAASVAGLKSLAVHPDYRRHGFGRLLLRRCMGAAEALGRVALAPVDHRNQVSLRMCLSEGMYAVALRPKPRGWRLYMTRRPRPDASFRFSQPPASRLLSLSSDPATLADAFAAGWIGDALHGDRLRLARTFHEVQGPGT